MKFLISLLITLNTAIVGAQSTVIVKDNTIDVGVFVPGVNENKYADVEGSPYLTDDFLPAKVNDMKKTQLVRFNPVDHDIEVKTTKGILRIDISKKYIISLVDGSEKTYETGNYLDENGILIRTYFEHVDGLINHKLYKRERKKFIPRKKVEGYADAKPATFIPLNDAFYISDFKSNKQTLLEIPRKKKKFYSFFGKSSKDMMKYIKKERLGIATEADLVKIFNYYFSTQK